MKPVPFDYIRPNSVAETCALLAQDAEARVIAGGQSLVPMLAMRLARPTRLIDILRLPELAGIKTGRRQHRHRRHHTAGRGRARSADRGQAAAARPSVSLGRTSGDAAARHHRRLAGACRSVGGNSAGGAHARCRHYRARCEGRDDDQGQRLFLRSDGHRHSARRATHRDPLSRLAAAAYRHRLS